MSECAWCGDEVTGKAVTFKKLSFCSDDCRDEWEEDAEAGEDAELDEDELDDDLDEDDDDDTDVDDDKDMGNY
jgi:hypothetical protein